MPITAIKHFHHVLRAGILYGHNWTWITIISIIKCLGDLYAYDYGPEENLKRYGSVIPYHYDLKKVTVPVYIFYSDKEDKFVPKGVN